MTRTIPFGLLLYWANDLIATLQTNQTGAFLLIGLLISAGYCAKAVRDPRRPGKTRGRDNV